MKFSLASLIALALTSATVMALPEPAPAVAEVTFYRGSVEKRALEKRTNSATVEIDGLKYYTCPRTSCHVLGQYPKGTHINIVCYTRDDTTTVNDDRGWALLTSESWVALSNGQYVSWQGGIPHC